MRPITSQGRRASTSFIPVERPRTAVPSDRLKFIVQKQSSENSIFSSSMSNAARSSYRPSSAGRSDTFIEYRRQQHEKMMERKNSQSSNLSSNDGSFRDAAKDERRDGVETSSANSSTGSSRKNKCKMTENSEEAFYAKKWRAREKRWWKEPSTVETVSKIWEIKWMNSISTVIPSNSQLVFWRIKFKTPPWLQLKIRERKSL